MAYSDWTDEDDGPFEAPAPSKALPYLGLIGVLLIGFGVAVAAAMVLAWAVGWTGKSNVRSDAGQAPATQANANSQSSGLPADTLQADRPTQTRTVVARPLDDIESYPSVGLVLLPPGWLFDSAAQAVPSRFAVASLAQQPTPEQPPAVLKSVPLPMANPLLAGRVLTAPGADLSRFPDAGPDLASAPLPVPHPLGRDAPQDNVKLAALPPSDQPLNDEPLPPQIAMPTPGDRFAVYDIKGQVVHMPSGEKLEAHSGYGEMFDDPRHVSKKMVGPTPPNTYDLTMREALFHGVEALRMKPVGGGKMYGRDGFLTHSYLLGPRGDSNGCISFKDYPAFLAAYKRGEVTRIVVVASLPGSTPAPNPLLSWLKLK